MKLINNSVVDDCISVLVKNSPYELARISYEIQDDFNFLLISVVTDGVADVSPLDRKRLAKLVDEIAPKRAGEYSWMINFLLNGVIFDSYFGGDLLSPDSGL